MYGIVCVCVSAIRCKLLRKVFRLLRSHKLPQTHNIHTLALAMNGRGNSTAVQKMKIERTREHERGRCDVVERTEREGEREREEESVGEIVRKRESGRDSGKERERGVESGSEKGWKEQGQGSHHASK